MREASAQMVRQVETEVRDRQEALRAEVRKLEHRKRDALERLHELAAALQDLLPGGESLARDLRPERAARGPSGS
jgi:chaperonin cofactor prefoldin